VADAREPVVRLIARRAGDRLLEVGIGDRPEVAAALADAGRTVAAVDVVERPVPPGVAFLRADVVDLADGPDPAAALPVRPDAVYGLNLPPELHAPTARLARRLDAACLFTTLGFEAPAPSVPVARRTAGDETVYVVDDAL